MGPTIAHGGTPVGGELTSKAVTATVTFSAAAVLVPVAVRPVARRTSMVGYAITMGHIVTFFLVTRDKLSDVASKVFSI